MSDKVKFGLRNVHYAVKTVDETGAVTYGTPIRIPGAVEATFDPRGDLVEFYADDMMYYTSPNNQGYDGSLSIAMLPESFVTAVLGEIKDQNGVLIESADARGQAFALLFEVQTDKRAKRHVWYNCTASRPTVSSGTTTNTAEPNTTELSFVSSAREDNRYVKVNTTSETNQAAFDSWYTAVYEPTLVEEPVEP